MVKHWPGGGPGEAGRDAHYGKGKYAVYPGNGMRLHEKPFIEGAFNLQGPTKCCSAVMPYYTLCVGQTKEGVANGFSREMIQERLRDRLGYDGVVCTDWEIVLDETDPDINSGKPWGVDHLSVAERHLKCWLAGVDQFGGVRETGPMIEAYRIGCERLGEDKMTKIIRRSARRLLTNIIRVGLFENPYVDLSETAAKVGCDEWKREGFAAQVKSVMMLKNRNQALPLKAGAKVWFPDRYAPVMTNFWHSISGGKWTKPMPESLASEYFTCVKDPGEADAAVIFVESPLSGWGYSKSAAVDGKTPYLPISLQYEDYTAEYARAHSLAGGDIFESFTNRTYRGRSVTTPMKSDLEQVLAVRKAMGSKPVVVVMDMTNPAIPNEVERAADAFLAVAAVQKRAILEILSGRAEPSALLPFQMPRDMKTVEEQCEDLPYDMQAYVDSEGNQWDFGFGLNWSGIITDARANWAKECKSKLKGIK